MRGLWIFLWAPLLPLGCGGGGGPSGSVPSPAGALTVLDAPVSFSVVEGSIQDDPVIEAMVAPFRARMGEEIQQVIGESTGMLSKAVPEGTLGNFATDAMLWAANARIPEPAHMALTNNGGLRVPIIAGPITMGQMYELMPFENMLSVLVLSGSQVQVLCDQLADVRGEPIAGFSFRIEVDGSNRVARDVMVGSKPLDLEAEYRLVTNDYMANGGDSPSVLQSPVAREDLPVLLRDAFIDYVRYLGVIEPKLEGRITGGIGR
jgi:2',3'-cyclic-nucleotide 2'-phosphodiesterase (5'-nucleotidase family)